MDKIEGDRTRVLGTEEEPVRYIGQGTADCHFHDGRLPLAVGVQNYQVLRANRANPEQADGFGWTYNHAPMLAYWKNYFYIEYLSTPLGEHTPPGKTLIMKSPDGIHWEIPRVVFPEYQIEDGTYSIMHQRMGFYVTPRNRLFALGFYGICPTPDISPTKHPGIGRVVREVYEDGSFSDIYFIRYNKSHGRDESNTNYPFYKSSEDEGFILDCEALLSDKLMTLQWWEEDRSTDGFYSVSGVQAPSYYHRKDGKTVALWKWSYAALSSDEGKTWTKVVKVPTFTMAGAKVWGQKTKDNRYAIVYNPTADNQYRWPLAAVTSEDGINFDEMCVINGEVAPLRYIGPHKDLGPQYVRGIEEGNGNPPGQDMWLVYSMNKEDIWISRVPTPLRHTVEQQVQDDFDQMETQGVVTDWNIYSGKWAKVSVVEFPEEGNKCLQLKDEDPCGYAKAVRIFPESKTLEISFRLLAEQSQEGSLEVEVLDKQGKAAISLVFDGESTIKVVQENKARKICDYIAQYWYEVKIKLDIPMKKYDLHVNDICMVEGDMLESDVASVQRISYKTGCEIKSPEGFLLNSKMRLNEQGEGAKKEEDIQNSDNRTRPVIYYIDYLFTK